MAGPAKPSAPTGTAAMTWALPERLRPYVQEVTAYCYDPGAMTAHRGMPSTSMTVVLAFEQPIDVGWFGRPESRQTFWAMASGLGLEPAHIRLAGHQEGIMLGLTPAGARALFGVPAAELQRELVSFDDLIGVERTARLYDAVAGASGWPARFAALERAFSQLIQCTGGGRGPRPEVARAWTQLTRVQAKTPQVAEVADEVGWSRRHLGEQFRHELGITPTDARRLARFSRSHQLARKGHRLIDVAMTSGYADQAHMTREWRELSAYTPGEWARAELSFVQDDTA